MRLRLETDGAAIRGSLSDDDFGRIAEMAGNAFAFLDGGGGDASLRETWISVGTIWLTNFEHCVAPELARDLVALLSREANRTLGLSHLVVNMCSIRQLTDWQKGLQWHTDYHGGGTHPYDPLFNIWLPLTAVGREQPSVELVRGSHRRMRELPSETGVYTDEWVAEHFPPTDRIAPELAPGDALIFDHLTLHRTQPLDRETVSRMSIECRVTRHPAYLALSQASSRLPGKSPPQPRSLRARQDVQ
jgi:ectoine hydroxylase-related dioxygenase (phytanoyl-CoA dioxygenase family)